MICVDYTAGLNKLALAFLCYVCSTPVAELSKNQRRNHEEWGARVFCATRWKFRLCAKVLLGVPLRRSKEPGTASRKRHRKHMFAISTWETLEAARGVDVRISSVCFFGFQAFGRYGCRKPVCATRRPWVLLSGTPLAKPCGNPEIPVMTPACGLLGAPLQFSVRIDTGGSTRS